MTWLVDSYAYAWPEVDDLQAALVCAVACALLGWFAPRLIARLAGATGGHASPRRHPGGPHRQETEKDAELVTGEGLDAPD